MGRLAAFAVLVAGCYSPNAATNVPCGPGGACPIGQTCDFGQAPPVCVLAVVDAALADSAVIDSPVDAPAVACSDTSPCPAATPVCDQNQCRGCIADAECTNGICSESQGTCIDASAVLYVAPNGADGGACTQAAPCATISGALAQVDTTRRSIRVADGNYNDAFLIANMGAILISGETASWSNTTINFMPMGFGGTALDHVVENQGSMLTIEGLTLRNSPQEGTRVSNAGLLSLFRVRVNNTAGGVDCNSSTAIVDQCLVVGNNRNQGIGISGGGMGSTITVRRTGINGNSGIGIQLMHASYSITNAFVTRNGGTGLAIMDPGATAVIDYLTVAQNSGGASCSVALTIADSIFSENGAPPQVDPTCTATYTLFDDTAAPGTGNLTGEPAFVNPGMGDFHITSTSAARNAADPGSGEPIDYDGEVRPQGGGRDVGADEIP